MTDETDVLSPEDEFAALLPWYVTGKISEQDRAKVENYLAAHPRARAQLAVAREEADTIFAADAALEVPHYALDKLRASLATDPSVRLASAKSSLLDRISEVFAGLTSALSPRQLAFASMSAMLVVGVLAGMLASPFTSSQQYTVASNDAAVSQGTYALVALQPAAPAATLSAFLAENGYAIVDGPRAGGVYRVRIAQEVMPDAAADTARAKLKARADLFTFVSAAPSGAAN